QHQDIGSLVRCIGHREQDVNDGLGGQPWHRGRTDVLDLDGAAAERGADARSLASEKHRPVRIVVGESDRGVARRDLVQPEALDVLITEQARAVRFRRRLHGLIMASARSYLNRPEILARPTRNNGSLWARFLSPSGPIVRPQDRLICPAAWPAARRPKIRRASWRGSGGGEGGGAAVYK